MDSVGVVIEELGRLRRATRRLLVMRAIGLVLGALMLGLVAVAALDFVFRLPGLFRLLLLGGLAIATGDVIRRHLRPAIQYAPSLVDMALRVERQRPDLKGRLASGVEFVDHGDVDRSPLARLAVEELVPLVRGGFGRRIDARATTRVGGGAAALVGLILVALVLAPGFVGTGFARVMLPLSDAAWPARTAVSSLMGEVLPAPGVHPRGEVITLRARNLTPGGAEERVQANVRERRDGRPSRWRTITLAHQGDGVHERLIEADGEVLDVWFETTDARTDEERIDLVLPPAIVQGGLQITPPTYATDLITPILADLGPGIDDRARMDGSALAGSQAAFDIAFNKPIEPVDSPAIAVGESVAFRVAEVATNPQAAWLARTFGLEADAEVERTDETSWTLRWTVADSTVLLPDPRDAYGLGPREPIRYVINAVDDGFARPAVLEPGRDERTLADADVPVRIEAIDDVGLRRLAVTIDIERSGSAAVPLELPAAVAETLVAEFSPVPRRDLEAVLPLEAFDLVPGDVLLLRAEADDVFDPAEGRTVRSEPRRVRIIGEADFGTLLRRDLARVRQEAIRIEARQSEIQDEVNRGEAGTDTARAQAELAERIAAQRADVESLNERVERNRLEDDQLRELLRQSTDLLDFAGRAANRALSSLEAAAEAGGESGENEDPAEAGAPEEAENPGEAGEPRASGQPSESGQAGEAGEAGASGQPSESGQAGEAGEPGASGQPSESGQAGEAGEPSASGQPSESGQPGEAGEPSASGQPSESGQPGEPGAPGESTPAPSEAAEAAAEAQQEVREELTDLIRLLDRDEDTWLVRQQLERIAQEQSALEERTGEVADDLIGRDLEDLSDGERNLLDEIAEEQQALAESFDRLIEEMRRRAEAMEEADPEAADGLTAAADEGETREASRSMREAAEQASENQLQDAGAQQAQAREALDRMQEALEQAAGVRTEELLRELASLRESLERLVETQERELMALARAANDGDLAERARSMIRLERNTGSTAQEARVAGQELRRIARTLDRAREAQGDAIGSLRGTPPDAEAARVAEEDSLARLQEALEFATEAEEQAEEDLVAQAREELMAAYRGLLERQAVVRAETLELAALPQLGRRGRQTARRLGNDQETIRVALEAIRTDTEGLADATVFSYVHEMLDGWSVQVRDRLYESRVGTPVSGRQLRIAEAIRRQVEALEELQSPPPEFANGEQAQGGEGGGQGGGGQSGGAEPILPPTAELMRLRGLQEAVYEETRAINDDASMGPDERAAMVDELGRMQRDIVGLAQKLIEQLTPARPDQPTPSTPGTPGTPGDQPAPADPVPGGVRPSTSLTPETRP